MKTVLITGGTNGIGLKALEQLDKASYFPVLICRSEEKGQQLISKLGRGRFYLCELSDLQSVQNTCAAILENETQIDYFVANAGVIGFDKEQLSEFDIEMTIHINFLSHYILTQTLLPLFEQSNTKLIFTSSVMHRSKLFASYDFSNGLNTPNFSPFKAYSRSKACLTTYANYLARTKAKIIINIIDPGVVRTGIMRSRGWLMNQLFGLAKYFFASPEKGSTPLFFAITNAKSNVNGAYIKGEKIISSNPRSLDINNQQELNIQAEKAMKTILNQ